MTAQVAAIIVAAGRGTRFAENGEDLPKQYQPLAGRPILSHTLDAFLKHPGIAHVLTVFNPQDCRVYQASVAATCGETANKLLDPVSGGATRQESVRNGLAALQDLDIDHVLIHDAARPFVTAEIIDHVLEKLAQGEPAVLSAVPVFDTLKKQSSAGQGLETVDRTGIWSAQTPQGFDYPAILDGHDRARVAGHTVFTDDTAIAEWMGLPVVLADGDPDNFKITTRADLDRAERRFAMTNPSLKKLATLGDIRMGTGYDVHAFDEGDAVILGGIEIAHDRKLKGHSDADVVLHAITDAILGAIADGDIGAHFPPSDPQWKGAASDKFLIDAIRRVTDLGGMIAHIDATIICEAPKIGPHRDAMRQAIAQICSLPVSRVSVKATTSERLGFTGRKEGIAAMASATVRLPFNDLDAS